MATFDDFQPVTRDPEAKKRMRRSVGAAIALYGSLGAGLVVATATARHVVEEELRQVEFVSSLPEPEPPPPAAEPTPEPQSARPRAQRPRLAPPKEISKQKLRESDGDLAAADAPGSVGGFLDGVEGGTGNRPAPRVEKAMPPEPMRGNKVPTYSAKVRRKGIEGVVVVTFDVTATGTVTNVRIVSGPSELHEIVERAVATWRFKPARRGDKAIPWRKTQSIRFRLEDA